jgi:hypothetical protein
MNVNITTSGTKITFTKSDVGKLRAAANLLCALDRQTGDADVNELGSRLDAVLARIDEKGVYTERGNG